MFILLTLLLFCTLTYAADDRRDLIPFLSSFSMPFSYQSNAVPFSASSSTDALNTPEDYLHQLVRDSAALEKNPIDGEHNFVLNINDEDVVKSLPQIDKYINNHFPTLQEYLPYFIALAQNSSLSDSKKIQKKYVYVPPIAQLNTQEDKDEKLRQAILINYNFNYSICRLLFAAFIYGDANPNIQRYTMIAEDSIILEDGIMHVTTCKNDISLLREIVNSQIFNPDSHSEVYSSVISVHAAELLMNKRVPLQENINLLNPLIYQCTPSDSEKSIERDLIDWYLIQMPRTEENENGQIYLKEIVKNWKKSYRQANLRTKIIELFLMHDYLYDDALKNDIIETIVNSEENVQEKDNVRKKIELLFDQHETQNTKPAKNK